MLLSPTTSPLINSAISFRVFCIYDEPRRYVGANKSTYGWSPSD
jgi:hypothetical protein